MSGIRNITWTHQPYLVLKLLLDKGGLKSEIGVLHSGVGGTRYDVSSLIVSLVRAYFPLGSCYVPAVCYVLWCL